jgi:glycosyltransferase involved in cell wall biosynthesis
VPAAALLVPGRLDTKTGGYGYDRRIVDGLRDRGWSIDVHEIEHAPVGEVLARIADGTVVLADGLAFGAMPDEAAAHGTRLRFVALVHHPLADETGLDDDAASRLRESERRALRVARAVVVTSDATARTLAAYDVPPDRITVITPGADPAPLARGSGHAPTELLCVASVIPRKGHNVLFRALVGQRAPWHLTCVGGRFHAETARRLDGMLRELDLAERVTFAGEMDGAELEARYDAADVFVLPTLYEGYGMVVAEALAHGLPVVATRTGAIAELVTPDAGILVDPGDLPGLRDALARVLDADVRRTLAAGAAGRRHVLPTWDQSVDRMAEVLRSSGA